MPFAVTQRILDVALAGTGSARGEVLWCGTPDQAPDPRALQYDKRRKIIRWLFGVMGETRPLTSPLSVDIANDDDYRVYRYDWFFGVSCLPQSEYWWNWQQDLREIGTQIVIVPGDAGFAHSYVATNLNALPPSRNTESWWQKNREPFVKLITATGDVAGVLNPTAGKITKKIAAMANSLESQERDQTNWFVYQFLDQLRGAPGVEWRIDTSVMKRHGPLLRGSLVLAFHGRATPGSAEPGISLEFRPMLRYDENDLAFFAPDLPAAERTALQIIPTPPASAVDQGD